MKIAVILLLMAAAVALIAILLQTRRVGDQYVEGGLYSVAAENGGYAVVKILRIDNRGVHLRLFSNIFRERPRHVDPRTLYLAGMDHKPNEQLGMGHAPISYESFRTWNAMFIQKEAVQPGELDGYRMWKEAKGGYF